MRPHCAKGRRQAYAPQQTVPLFNDLVGAAIIEIGVVHAVYDHGAGLDEPAGPVDRRQPVFDCEWRDKVSVRVRQAVRPDHGRHQRLCAAAPFKPLKRTVARDRGDPMANDNMT
jgi:hypothetical protein